MKSLTSPFSVLQNCIYANRELGKVALGLAHLDYYHSQQTTMPTPTPPSMPTPTEPSTPTASTIPPVMSKEEAMGLVIQGMDIFHVINGETAGATSLLVSLPPSPLSLLLSFSPLHFHCPHVCHLSDGFTFLFFLNMTGDVIMAAFLLQAYYKVGSYEQGRKSHAT